jgi:hypothetical protein
MLSEHFDKEIKESLEQRNPAYDERAWEKMKPLLNKYLPLKKDDRRRLLFLLFLFLLLGGGSWLALRNSSAGEKPVANNPAAGLSADKKEKTQSTAHIPSPGTKQAAKNQEPGADLPPQNISLPGQGIRSSTPGDRAEGKQKKNINPEKLSLTFNNKKKPPKNSNSNPPIQHQNDITVSVPDILQNIQPENKITNDPEISNNTNKLAGSGNDKNKQADNSPAIPVTDETIPAQDEKKQVADTEKSQQVSQQKKQNKKSGGFLSNLGITVSAGPDLSIVEAKKTGQVRLNYGAGLSYTVLKRFSIRSGFFISRKIYSAGPEDYNPPPAFWNYYTNLKKIDADCKIFEVPVTVDYYFAGKKNYSWFAAAGLSSFFMKKEEYDYLFKPAYSPTYISYKHTYENENKHYFSVLNISGGYSRKLNNKISIQAEPFMKIALNGIGYGKVKLNSGGILFTATFKPFSPGK